MSRGRLKWAVAAGLAWLAVGATPVWAQEEKAATAGGLRVGVFDSRAVAMAYARSAEEPGMGPQIKRLMDDHKKAKAAGDTATAKRLQDEGRRRQDLLHQQGFSTASVANIVEKIKDQLPAIAQQAQVDLIVSKWEAVYLAPDSRTVDVTESIVKLFHPSADTLKRIAELKKIKPISLDESMKIPTGH